MSKKILIAISNNFTLDVFNKNFSEDGFETITANNGDQAFGLAKENLPNIIIADAFLENLNGFDLIEKLRENEITKKIPVVIYSRSGSSEHKERAIDLMAKDFINGLSDSPKQSVLKVKIHLGAQKSYTIKPATDSLERAGELASDLGRDIKCSSCGENKALYLMRNLNARENDFKLSFICPHCFKN